MNPNSFEEEVEDATIANPIETSPEGTEPEVDYKSKFTFSSQEAIRLKKENEQKDALIAELQEKEINNPYSEEELYPNFGELDEEAKTNLLAYTENIKRGVREELYKDPALAFARGNYNEHRWNEAFATTLATYPEITDTEDFKSKYFNPQNVPDNIDEILQDVAKIYLFDKAKEIGADGERKKANRIEIETATGGEKTPTARRSIEDWDYLRRTNPAKFASLDKEYEEDSKHF